MRTLLVFFSGWLAQQVIKSLETNERSKALERSSEYFIIPNSSARTDKAVKAY